MKTQVLNSAKKATVAFMIILTVSVINIANAQGISGFVAMLSPVNEMTVTTAEKIAVAINTRISDNELNVEEWMSSDNYWHVNEYDESLSVEPWMSDNSYWGVNEEVTLSESPLTIENWMSSDSYWNGGQKESDNKLAIESWMTSNEYWGVK